MATLRDHLLNIPPVTRFFTIVTLATALTNKLDLVNTQKFFYYPYDYLEEWLYILDGEGTEKVWRFIYSLTESLKFFSTFFFASGEGPFIFLKIYTFYQYSSNLESRQGKFRNNFPDYLWFIVVTGTLLILWETVVALASNLFEALEPVGGWITPSYHRKLLACISFVWLRHLKTSTVNFLGIFRIRSYYLPLFDLGLAIVESRPAVWDCVAGTFVGYLYLCIQSDTLPFYNLVPRVYGKDDPRLSAQNRVGLVSKIQEEFSPAIFDLGYLKAPLLLYKLLGFPTNTSRRSTAFTKAYIQSKEESNGFRSSILFDEPGNAFKGTGHRLGGSPDKTNASGISRLKQKKE